MKLVKLFLLLVLLGATGVGDANAGRGHGHGHRHFGGPVLHFGWGFGPFWGPWYPPAYYAPVVVQQSYLPVYIERASESAPANFWYYCAAAKGYYPYVKQCPGGWQQVAPRPEDRP